MKSAYNYTAVETHKQKLYIPYIGIELNGWGMVLVMLGGLLFALIPIGIPAYHLFGSLGILLSICVTGDRRFDVPDRDRPGEPQEQADHVLLSGCEELSHPV